MVWKAFGAVFSFSLALRGSVGVLFLLLLLLLLVFLFFRPGVPVVRCCCRVLCVLFFLAFSMRQLTRWCGKRSGLFFLSCLCVAGRLVSGWLWRLVREGHEGKNK
ncbi:hypothetical protein BDB00DRAFT_246334 [Zychaea mexicana]|uniref:uncharacterized protein n=1 Tax=Zychaea mexicana TaxID=64656 RepID=UPI0022FE1F9A|nr:uncharacterized protein BDB00DRAFT_246334 [Zychaea mexicana]KAI9495387.1 hypothetical protein BDB00DRAFT_246334 [Zychaea mexicana]